MSTIRYTRRPLSAINAVVIHHSASPPRADGDWERQLREFAGYQIRTHGWPGIAYHLAVAPDGRLYQTQALSTISYHCPNWNSRGVGIVLIGDFTAKRPPVAQVEGVKAALRWLKQELPATKTLIGHREGRSTECPGKAFPSALLDELAASAGLQRS